MDELPSLPVTVIDALRIANDTSASADRLEQAICRDLSLAARVLKVANSAFVGFRRQIDSVQEAIVLLGTRRIRAVATMQALAPMFESNQTDLISGRQLWAHGLATALWTQQIGQRIGYPKLAHVYTAGLMHDMGIVLLRGVLGEEYERVVDEVRRDEGELSLVETERLGLNHCRVGAMVCAKWMLSPRLTWLISHHHDDGLPDDVEAQILILADWCAQEMGVGEFPWSKRRNMPIDIVQALGLHPAEIPDLMNGSRFITEQIESLLGG